MRPTEPSLPEMPPRANTDAPMAALDYGLYALTVFAWSTSWIALKNQLGVVAPEVSLVWRFGLSAILMFVWALVTRERMRFSLSDHLRFAGLGVFIFSFNFVLFYHGGMVLTSGLLAVIFSLASVFNMLLGAVFLGQRIDRRVLAGAAFGFAGVALMFWPEIAGTEFDHRAAIGLALCVGGTLSFCTGNMISATNQRRGLPVVPANAYGMAYGTAFLAIASLLMGHAFIIEPTARYLVSLGWLSVVSSVLAFAAYLTLLGRIGSGRAGYSTVLFPVFALAISTVFENYHWTAAAIAGLVLVMIGNVIVLRR